MRDIRRDGAEGNEEQERYEEKDRRRIDRREEEIYRGKEYRAGIFKKSMGARHRGGIGFSYRPARLHRLAEFIPWHQFRGPINI
jgi:hypothetical protein